MKKEAALGLLILALPACKHLSCKKEQPMEPIAIEVVEVQPADEQKAE